MTSEGTFYGGSDVMEFVMPYANDFRNFITGKALNIAVEIYNFFENNCGERVWVFLIYGITNIKFSRSLTKAQGTLVVNVQFDRYISLAQVILICIEGSISRLHGFLSHKGADFVAFS